MQKTHILESISPFVHDIDDRSLDKTQTDQEQTKLGYRSNLLQEEGMNYSYTISKINYQTEGYFLPE
jgi:hypothetical protein